MKLLVPEFRSLPPNHLRVRVGVGNKLFNNHAHCLLSGFNFWIDLFSNGRCALDSSIVELGCGYGRKAAHLKNYSIQGDEFTGSYLGIDVDDELLEYAKNAFTDGSKFTFQKSPHSSRTYGSRDMADLVEGVTCRIECHDDSQDLVYSTSLFTHLLEEELKNYVEESYRVLKPGAVMQMNVFVYEFLHRSGNLGSRFKFKHRKGNAYIESLDFPEAAVAYSSIFLESLCAEIGFSDVELRVDDVYGEALQSFLICTK
ncbi:hypothetical protein AB833_02625 [Chromatiales bacterium (ex Bugula neritina AB1)]|nr:hypothetical protein AB833_02625 [Chromatiales bacterium (ex Bugula neritina AB1)]